LTYVIPINFIIINKAAVFCRIYLRFFGIGQLSVVGIPCKHQLVEKFERIFRITYEHTFPSKMFLQIYFNVFNITCQSQEAVDAFGQILKPLAETGAGVVKIILHKLAVHAQLIEIFFTLLGDA
jgi:hypothetical protein